MPHKTLDSGSLSPAIVGQLQTLVSRGVDPIDSAVLTIGKIDGGTVENIIPMECCIYGTRAHAEQRDAGKTGDRGPRRISQHVAEAHLCEAT
jgi:hippurate hydrolase